jgi:hypothetical protein
VGEVKKGAGAPLLRQVCAYPNHLDATRWAANRRGDSRNAFQLYQPCFWLAQSVAVRARLHAPNPGVRDGWLRRTIVAGCRRCILGDVFDCVDYSFSRGQSHLAPSLGRPRDCRGGHAKLPGRVGKGLDEFRTLAFSTAHLRHPSREAAEPLDCVAKPRWPTVLGQARHPLAPGLGSRPKNVYRAAASE